MIGRQRVFAAGCLVLGLAVSGCSTPVSPSGFAPFSQTDLVVGEGETGIGENQTARVEYTGWLYDPDKADHKGAIFDSSRGREPFVFVLGQLNVIEGWEQGIRGMKPGGIRRLVVPPSMAYGGNRTGGIPPYSTLIFEIELILFE